MRMLRVMCGHIFWDRIQNEDLRNGLGVIDIEEKMKGIF